jgi:hypothetical protein
MSHRYTKDEKSPEDIRKYVGSSQIANKRENSRVKMNNLPNGQTTSHRPCLKHQPKVSPDNGETGRLSTGRVSFAHAVVNDGKTSQVTSQPQNDSNDKKRRSAIFAKKAKDLQLAELTYFKDHARDAEPPDE